MEEEEKEEVENNEDWANDPLHPGPELHLVSSVQLGRRGRGRGRQQFVSISCIN